jgi:TP901 family phage tail tape measure protein
MAGNNPIKYSKLFIDDGAIEKLIEKLNQVEKTYKNLSKSITKEAQKLKTEAQNVNLADDESIKRISELEKKIESLIKKRKKEKETLTEVEKLKRRLNRLKTDEAKKEQELKIAIQERTKTLKDSIKQDKSATGSMKQVEAALRRNILRYKSLSKSQRESTREGKQLLKTIQAQDKQVKKLNESIGRSQGFVGNYARAFKGLGRSILQLSGVAGGIAFITDAFSRVKDFEQAQADLQAITGKTSDELKGLTAQAKALGETTQFSASEVTELQIELGKLGFTTKQVSESTEGILNLAAATGTELGRAAKLTGSALRAFNLEATESERVASVLGVATTKTALDISQLETGLSTVAPVAASFGFSIEETVALLGQLSNAGFDASSSATATRNILLNLADSNGDLAKQLGKPVTNIRELSEGLQKLSDDGIDLASALELTDKRSVAAFNTFIKGSDSVIELTDSITGQNDALRIMAEKRLDTLNGALKLLNSAWEGFLLDLNQGSGALDGLRRSVLFLANNLRTIIKVLALGATVWASYKAGVIGTNLAIKGYSLITTAARVASISMTYGIRGAKKAFQALNVTMKANPIGLVVSAVTTLIGVFSLFGDEVEEETKKQEDFNKELDKTRRSMLTLDEIIGQIEFDKFNIDTTSLTDLENALSTAEENLKNFNPDEVAVLFVPGEDAVKTAERQEKAIQVAREARLNDVLKLRELVAKKERLIQDELSNKDKTRIGLLVELRNKIKDLREEQDKTRSEDEIKTKQKQINQIQEQIDALTKLDKKKKKSTDKDKENAKSIESIFEKFRKQREDGDKELQKIIDDIENENILNAIESEREKQERLLKIKRDALKKEVEETVANEKKKKEALKKIDDDFKRDIENLRKEETKEQIRELQDVAANAAIDAFDNVLNQQINKLDALEEKQLRIIDRQSQRAAEGLENNLAFEESVLAEIEQKKIKAQKKQIQLDKIRALYSAYSGAAASGDSNALVSVLRDFSILQGLESAILSFGTGTGEHGDVSDFMDANKNGSKNGNSINNGVIRGESHAKRGKGIPVLVEGNEGIWKGSTMKKFGKDNFVALTSAIDSGVIGSNFMQPQVNAIQVSQTPAVDSSLLNEMKATRQAIENKPDQVVDVEKVSKGVMDFIDERRTANKRVINRHRVTKKRF